MIKFIIIVLFTSIAFTQAQSSGLKPEQKKFLDSLFEKLLFDPSGAKRVSFEYTTRNVWTAVSTVNQTGWMKNGKIYLEDGYEISIPKGSEIKEINFIEQCEQKFSPQAESKEPDHTEDDLLDFDKAFNKMRLNAVGLDFEHDILLAAWLYKLDREKLAAKAMEKVQGNYEEEKKKLYEGFRWSAYSGLVHAYMVRADEEALNHGKRLQRLEPENKHPLVSELLRRKKIGTFGKTPDQEWPAGYDKWETEKKIKFLISSLDEVDARQMGQPGGVPLSSDRRIMELIKIGDPAIPALLDSLEFDKRLTRSVHFWRDFSTDRTVISVKEASLTAIMSIIKVQVFAPSSTGDNFSSRKEEMALAVVKQLRAYWLKYGKYPFDERMMKVLLDPDASFPAKREAAKNIASINDKRYINTMFGTYADYQESSAPNPVIKKFSKPSVAEIILKVMDEDLKNHDHSPPKELSGIERLLNNVNGGNDDHKQYERRKIEDNYAYALIKLNDQRIGPEIAKRAQAGKSHRQRRLYTEIASSLDQSKPLISFALDFEKGKITPEGIELKKTIEFLIKAKTKESERALNAVTLKEHPLFSIAKNEVLNSSISDNVWFNHSICLKFLLNALHDKTPVNIAYSIDEMNRLVERTENSSRYSKIPEFLSNHGIEKNKTVIRVCDQAAKKLSAITIGLEQYDPLMKGAEERLGTIAETLERYLYAFRKINKNESSIFETSYWSPTYIPEIKTLTRPASENDLKQGNAIFHLSGQGEAVDLNLPKVSHFKNSKANKVIVVQAERSPEGLIYGIIAENAILKVNAKDLESPLSFEQYQKVFEVE